jgi:CBS domain containing-hemolysin-like protein
MYEIFKSGYSRIPVYENSKNDIVGLILAKDLIFVDPEVGGSMQCYATYDAMPDGVAALFDLKGLLI